MFKKFLKKTKEKKTKTKNDCYSVFVNNNKKCIQDENALL